MEDILTDLKPTFIEQSILGVLITYTPGRRSEFNDCQNTKVPIAVRSIMDVNTHWNWTVQLLEWAYLLQDFTCELLENPIYGDYWPLFTTQDEGTFFKCVMEVSMSFPYWTLWTSKRHTATLHNVITVYNDMIYHMYGAIRALAKKKTQWKEDL